MNRPWAWERLKAARYGGGRSLFWHISAELSGHLAGGVSTAAGWGQGGPCWQVGHCSGEPFSSCVRGPSAVPERPGTAKPCPGPRRRKAGSTARQQARLA